MKILAVDLGDARTGLACCDKTEFLASPIGVIGERNFERLLDKVAAAVREYEAQLVIVGNPVNMNGSLGPRSQKSTLFVERLRELVWVPVMLWDERGTTVMAHNAMNVTNTHGKKRKEVVDAVAAVMILENYLIYRKNQNAFLAENDHAPEKVLPAISPVFLQDKTELE